MFAYSKIAHTDSKHLNPDIKGLNILVISYYCKAFSTLISMNSRYTKEDGFGLKWGQRIQIQVLTEIAQSIHEQMEA